MKKQLLFILILCFAVLLSGCRPGPAVKNTFETDLGTYYEMTDGTWQRDGRSYAQRLELRGRLSSAACDTVYVYLSNVPISFDQAWKASGLSSSLSDYFAPEDAVLVETRVMP